MIYSVYLILKQIAIVHNIEQIQFLSYFLININSLSFQNEQARFNIVQNINFLIYSTKLFYNIFFFMTIILITYIIRITNYSLKFYYYMAQFFQIYRSPQNLSMVIIILLSSNKYVLRIPQYYQILNFCSFYRHYIIIQQYTFCFMPNKHIVKGCLIAFQGLDKTGKTTHSAKLYESLNKNNMNCQLIRFPDRTTQIGKLIDKYLKKQLNYDRQTVHILFSANRWQNKIKIQNLIKQNAIVILDRFIWSGLAYSSALGINYEWAKQCDKGLRQPDLIFYMKSQKKIQERNNRSTPERYQNQEFQKKVQQFYNKILKQNKQSNIIYIDSMKNQEQNSKEIFNQTLKYLNC